MKVLHSWLREFAPISTNPDEVAKALNELGTAVESIEYLGANLDGIVVAKVLNLRKHPGADRIQLVDVDMGDGEALQIACGAFNMEVGDHVPLAVLGTTMPNGIEITRRKMRGEWSNGMLCSGSELGLGDDHSGILILPGSSEVGTDVKDALGISSDVLFDLEVNPNRPDAMSVAGVARDLAAWFKVPFVLPKPQTSWVDDDGLSAAVEVLAPELCGRFLTRQFRNVTVGDSPDWLVQRLLALGMRPINSLVDISNYVMLELGQPNHPYDLARLRGGGLRVRRAHAGETIVTLDDVERRLEESDLLIADLEDRPMGIAGVMGAEAAEVSSDTTDVLLEMAWFDPISVAKTSRRLGLRTEASARFEKGTDPNILELAALRFAELLGANGELLSTVGDVRGELPKREAIQVRASRVNQILGTQIDAATIPGLIEPIGFSTKAIDSDTFAVQIPSWRPDSATEIDVIEEIARHYGYSRIERTVPRSPINGGLTKRQKEVRLVRNALVGLGFSEVMPTPFLAPGDLEAAKLDANPILLANPLVAEESVMRTSLLPGLAKVLAYNASHRRAEISIFEIGHVFNQPSDPNAPLPDETERLAFAIGGQEAPKAVQIWRALADYLGVTFLLEAAEVPGLHPTRSVKIVVNDLVIGALGEIDPEVLHSYEVPGRVAYLDVSMVDLLEARVAAKPYTPVRLYPSSDLDLAFELDETTPASALEAILERTAGDLLVSLQLFDVFRGSSVAEGRRSLAYRLRFQASDRTLSDTEITELRIRLIRAVEHQLLATLRS